MGNFKAKLNKQDLIDGIRKDIPEDLRDTCQKMISGVLGKNDFGFTSRLLLLMLESDLRKRVVKDWLENSQASIEQIVNMSNLIDDPSILDIDSIRKMSKYRLSTICQKNPHAYIKLGLPIDRLNSFAMISLLKIIGGEELEKKVVEVLPSIRNKTELKDLFKAHPSLVKHITTDHLPNLVMSAKEFTNCVSKIKDAEVNDDIAAYIETLILSECLSSKSKGSKQLSKAIEKITAKSDS